MTANFCRQKISEFDGKTISISEAQKVKDIVIYLNFMENYRNQPDIFEREASCACFGDSKYIENNGIESAVCDIAKHYVDAPFRADHRKILEAFHIQKTEQTMHIRGNVLIYMHSGEVLDASVLWMGLELSSHDIENIQMIRVQDKALMTIENKTSFERFRVPYITSVYLAGQASDTQIAILQLIQRCNPDLTYLHFGDIDDGGFKIYRSLKEVSNEASNLLTF